MSRKADISAPVSFVTISAIYMGRSLRSAIIESIVISPFYCAYEATVIM